MVRIKDDETQDVIMNASVATRIVIADKTNPRYQEAVDYIKCNPEAQKEYLKTCTQMDRKPEIDFDGIKGASPAPESTSAPAPEAASAPTSAPQPEPMTAKQAYAILVSQGRSAPDYDNLVKILQGDSILYNEYQKILEAHRDEDKELALAQKIDRMFDVYLQSKELAQKYSDEYKTNVFGKETRSAEGHALEADKTPHTWQALCDVVDIYAKDENGESIVDSKGEKVVLGTEEKNKWMSEIFAASKAAVVARWIGNEKVLKMSEEDGRRQFREEVNDEVLGAVATAVAASSVKMPEGKESEVGSEKFFAYTEKQSKEVRKNLEDLFDAFGKFDTDEAEAKKAANKISKDKKTAGQKTKEISARYAAARNEFLAKYKGKFKIDSDMILFGVASTAQKISQKAQEIYDKVKKAEFAARTAVSAKAKEKFASAAQKLLPVASFLTKKRRDLEEKADDISKGKYSKIIKPVAKAVAKGAKDSAKDNIIKIGTNIALGGVVSAIVASGAPIAGTAVLGYGIYHGVSSWVWPIVAEQRKAHRLAKEANKPISWKEAWELGKANATKTKVSKNGKKYYPYVVQGLANTALGLAGGICLKNVINKLSGDGTSVTAEAIKAGKHAWRLSRALTPAAAQMGDAGIMFISDRHDETNRKRAAQTAVGALITAGIGVTALEISEALAENAQLTAEPTLPEQTTTVVISDPTDSLRTSTAAADSLGIAPTEKVEPIEGNISGQDVLPENSVIPHFPKEWNEDMGITQKEFNILTSTTEGTLVDPEGKNITLDRAYMNLNDETMEKYFPNMTKEQVLYKYNRLYAMMRRAKDMGNGTLRELKTEKKFWVYNNEMTAMMKLLGCGEQISEKDGAGLADLFANKYNDIMSSGKGTNYNVGQSLAKGCHNDEGMWLKGAQKVVELPKETPTEPVKAETIPTQIKVQQPKLRAIVPPKSPAQLPNQEVTIGEVHRMTGDSRAAINGTGATVSEDATQTTSGQNHLKSNGYVYE
ncbi:MAG: hypothetical protein IJ830_01145 [Alphaproteobacteria bacterium]|nr:hypothetical protein [Alphaproteobacteria bacterium]